jgi:hypothetical protein
MTRTPPKDIGASVRARLLRLARERGEDFQHPRQRTLASGRTMDCCQTARRKVSKLISDGEPARLGGPQ